MDVTIPYGTHGLGENDLLGARAVSITFGYLSLAASLFILVTYCITSCGAWAGDSMMPMEYKVKAVIEGYMFQFSWLAIATLLTGLAFGLSPGIEPNYQETNNACEAQAYSFVAFPLAAELWTLVLTMEMHRFVYYPNQDLRGTFSRKRYGAYVLGCFLLGGVSAALVSFASSPGNAGLWCWFGTEDGLKNSFYFEFLPRVAVWLLSIHLYIHSMIGLRFASFRVRGHRIRSIFLNLYLYPLIGILLTTLRIIHRIWFTDGAYGSITSPAFAYIFSFLAPSQGLFNCIVYLCTSEKTRTLLCSCRKSPEAHMIDEALLSVEEGAFYVDDALYDTEWVDQTILLPDVSKK